MNVARSRLWTCLALSLVIGVLAAASADAGLFGLFGSKKKVVKPPKRLLVVFPFDQGSVSNVPDGFGEFIASDLRTMLGGSESYVAFLFRDRLAPIERAITDNALKRTDVAPPFAEDKARTLKLAQLLASDCFLVGEIVDFHSDRAAKFAEITLKADLYDGKTGKLVKTVSVTGRTPESVNTGEEDELRDMAKGAAVTMLIAEFARSAEPEVKPEAAPAEPAPAPPPAPEKDSSAPPAPAPPPSPHASQ